MKVLLDGRLIDNNATGISRYSLEIIKIYQEIYGYDNVFVIVNTELNSKPFKFFETKLKPFSILGIIKMYNFIKKIDVEVYHSLFYSNSLRKDRNKIYITTVHDLMYNVVPNFFSTNKFTNFLKKKYFDVIVGKSIKNSDYIISVSETTKQDVLNIFSKESYVVPEGVNVIKAKDSSILEQNSLIKDEYFLYVGNSRNHKNLDFLQLNFLKSNTDKKLVICGNSNNLNKKNTNKIIYLGFVNDNDLSTLYKNCSAFIFPSLYEGFGLPILEALHFNSKIFSSTGGALKEFPETVVNYFHPTKGKSLIDLIEVVESIKIDAFERDKVLKYYSWNNTKKITYDFLKRWNLC